MKHIWEIINKLMKHLWKIMNKSMKHVWNQWKNIERKWKKNGPIKPEGRKGGGPVEPEGLPVTRPWNPKAKPPKMCFSLQPQAKSWNLSEQWTGSAVSMSLYVYVWHARSYLYKPVLESGLGLASPPRLGASPLATQMNLNKFKRSCLYRLVPGSGLGLASPPRFGGLRMN